MGELKSFPPGPGSRMRCLWIVRVFGLAEGARFELAVHEVDAGFQDRWFQPLTHPSDNEMNYLARLAFCSETSCLPFLSISKPNASATSSALRLT
jgi:hypothetical protein